MVTYVAMPQATTSATVINCPRIGRSSRTSFLFERCHYSSPGKLRRFNLLLVLLNLYNLAAADTNHAVGHARNRSVCA